MAKQPQQTQPGWYEAPDMHQTLRFWDGSEWTDDLAPGPSQKTGPDAVTRVVIIALGFALGWFLIWVGAHAAPDTFYFPIKFVVEDLPSSLR
jgi:hypothetical protein